MEWYAFKQGKDAIKFVQQCMFRGFDCEVHNKKKELDHYFVMVNSTNSEGQELHTDVKFVISGGVLIRENDRHFLKMLPIYVEDCPDLSDKEINELGQRGYSDFYSDIWETPSDIKRFPEKEFHYLQGFRLAENVWY